MSQDSNTPVYVILGATGGVGTALCTQLAARGARLFLTARSDEALQKLQGTLEDAATHRVDARHSAEVEAAVAAAKSHYGRLDGLVNCVGSLMIKPAHLTSDEEWAETFAVNVDSSFYALRAATRAMDRSQGGSIVLLSSAAALYGLPNHEAIAAAKGALVSLVKSAAASYARQNIRVNAVAPGLTQTPLTERLTSQPAVADASLQMHALGRFGTAEEVAAAIAFLLEPRSSFITGQILAVDGGLSNVRPYGATAAQRRVNPG